MKNLKYLLLSFFVFGGSMYSLYTTTKADTVDSITISALKKYNLRGRVLPIRDYVGSHAAVNLGYASYGKKILNADSNVVYPGASLQKAMTGSMIVQLINESNHSKNPITQYTPVSRWYPEIKGSNSITLGNLMTQTGGVVDGKSESYTGSAISESEAVSRAVNRINQNGLYTKGTFRYNNDNYILLAGIIRKQTGKTYADNLQSRIIKPMGLNYTSMWNNIPSSRVRAVSYQYKGGKNYQDGMLPKDGLLSYILGAGNMYTNPEDYYKFQRGLHDGKILSADDYHYLTSLKTKTGNGYSGGLYTKSFNGGQAGTIKMVYGSLDADHYGNWVQLTAGNKKGIVMFINQNGGGYVEHNIKAAGLEILNKVKSNTFYG